MTEKPEGLLPGPKPYDMTKEEDRIRWFREMKGYLMCKGEDGTFLQQGTDREGRKFAYEAFLQFDYRTRKAAAEKLMKKARKLTSEVKNP